MSGGMHRDAPSFTDSILRRAGISARKFRAMLHACLLMDFRSRQFGRATGSKPKELITPLFWVIGQYLLIGGILSAILFARVDAYFFALASIGCSMLIIATSIIVEFNEVVLDPADWEVIGHQPIPVRTYAAARVTNLLGYVLLMTAAINTFPVIVGLGLRDTTWAFLPAYAVAALLGNLFVVGIVILIYTAILKGRPGESAREVLAWTQIILIMALVYGGQLIFRDPHSKLEMLAYYLPEWVKYLPPAWLAYFVDGFAPGSLGAAWWILGAGIVVVVLTWLAVIRYLSAAYAKMQPGSKVWRQVLMPQLPQPGSLQGPVGRLLTRTKDEAAAFWLCSTMFRRDDDLRMRGLPSLGVVFALLLLGIFSDQLANPFGDGGTAAVLSIASLYLVAMPIPTILHAMNFSRDHAAAWVLLSSPIVDRAGFAEGMRKAVMYRLLVPVLIALFIVFAWTWHNPLHALIHVAAGFIVVDAAGYATKIGILHRYPFSLPITRGEMLGSIMIFASVLSGIVLLLAVVHYYAAQSAFAFGIYMSGLVILDQLLRLSSRKVMQQRFGVHPVVE